MKTYSLSAARAGLKSVMYFDPGVNKVHAISDVGMVYSPPSGVFIIHPFV
jgi:hypothetical protein